MKNLLYLLLFSFPFTLFAQESPAKSWKWGATAGYESDAMSWTVFGRKVDESPNVWSNRPENGFSAGIFAAYPLTKTISFRPQLQGSFSQNTINFRFEDARVEQQVYRFYDIEMPLHIVLTNRKGAFPLKGSIIAGGRFGWNVANQPEGQHLSLYRERFGLDVGMGVEINLKKCKFQPEIVYSYGLNNLNDATLTDPVWGIGKALRDKLTVRVMGYF